MASPYAISDSERLALAHGKLEEFWFSRLNKKDPVARIGYALWVSDTKKLKLAIVNGDAAFWNNKGFLYWETMARSTVVNLATGLERAGFRGTFSEMRAKIKEVGLNVAYYHSRYVTQDIERNIGKVPGVLSLQQMARYHHDAFSDFGIPADFYGGTWLQKMPDEMEFKAYGNLYCHDCDSNEGFEGR